ncbi:biotin synthase BioB [PVC group bacterium (ex Bugula neritina AB1)]|nr:biotin synthase BioB [PVC group bacterium (ex Bugula neritina AB1)]
MNQDFYQKLTQTSLEGKIIDKKSCLDILSNKDVDLLPLLNAAYEVRKKHKGKTVTLHILNNIQNGSCPEDCNYCAQAKTSKAKIEKYKLKSEEEILAEAKSAYEEGAFRYCMASAGKGPSAKRVGQMCSLIEKIKKDYPSLQICLSAGLIDDAAAEKLSSAGLDRLNHNLNTSRDYYPEICTTHTYDDRVKTLEAAKNNNLKICSGLIVGMGESHEDIINVALDLRRLEASSIPVNFLLPIEGNLLSQTTTLTPEFCLRVLCLFRLLNPESELRAAAGREAHLKDLEVLALYPASSLFLAGYLNTQGNPNVKTLEMIQDAGFEIVSDFDVNEVLQKQKSTKLLNRNNTEVMMKTLEDLKPYQFSKQISNKQLSEE